MKSLGEVINGVTERLPEPSPEARREGRSSEGARSSRVSLRSDNANPLTSGGFAPIPRVLDEFILGLSRCESTRAIARVLWLVVLDLARYTDNQHHDVVVTNQGIADRRGVGLPNVKAAIWLLKKLRIVRSESPSFERFQDLKRNMARFTSQRRRLVWNSQERWILPGTPEELDQIAMLWNDYVGKSRKNGYLRVPGRPV